MGYRLDTRIGFNRSPSPPPLHVDTFCRLLKSKSVLSIRNFLLELVVLYAISCPQSDTQVFVPSEHQHGFGAWKVMYCS